MQSAGSTQADVAPALAAPSDALWIEGSAEDIQTLVRRLSRQSATAVVVTEARLAVGSRAADIAEAEGEPGQLRGKTSTEVPASGPLAQRLPPTLFPLPREPVSGELESPSEQAGGRRRVLLLIERVD